MVDGNCEATSVPISQVFRTGSVWLIGHLSISTTFGPLFLYLDLCCVAYVSRGLWRIVAGRSFRSMRVIDGTRHQ